MNPGIIDEETLSPMMRAYLHTKEQYKDCILFYRLGDFYELFFEDAIEISQVLDLVLTGKSCGDKNRAPMCGVPYHAAEGYIAKLVSKGYKVAICEQFEDENKQVSRSVVKVVTSGTVTDDSMLDEKKNNYLLSLYYDSSAEKVSTCYCDITTGELELCHFEDNLEQRFTDLLNRVQPSQVIGNESAKKFYNNLNALKTGSFPKFEQYFDYAFEYGKAKDSVMAQFGENALNVYELKSHKEDVSAVGGLLEYLQDTQKRSLKNILKIVKIKDGQYLSLDSNTRRNLELVETIRERKKYGSLLWLLDKTKTSMGARCFRKMFDKPLQNPSEINSRLDSVEELAKNLILRDRLTQALSNVRDIERISGKIAYGNVTPVELVNFGTSLRQIPEIKAALSVAKTQKLVNFYENLIEFNEIADLLEKAINSQASANMKNGNYIKEGFNQELDDLRHAKDIANKQKDALEEVEKEKTGIKNLRIGYTSVFGYYIEVSKSQLDKVPLRYIRKQTLTNSERFTTSDLKEIEDRLNGSEENALKLEVKLYNMLIEYLTNYLANFLEAGKIIAEVDALLALAVSAVKYNFCKPVINKNVKKIEIQEGRHPIVENFVKEGSFIANDTYLDEDENQIMIITGPNMAGKSTYMRQVALITFLAHIGSFVPAKHAEISLTDRIFTRVGASDDLAFGQSTFMVEMSEVATILANATDKSLVILDEIGRGTSTFDGLSIAWAVVEHLAKNFHCKTLFATHYHELSELEGVLKGVKNFKITVKEVGDSVIFLRKIVRGAASKSFGIEVARLAGVPNRVIERAKEISVNLEKVNQKLDMNIFGEDEERKRAMQSAKLGQSVVSVLKDLDINKMSPLESFEILNDLIEKVKENRDGN